MSWSDLQVATKKCGPCLKGHSLIVDPDTGQAKCFRCGYEVQMVLTQTRMPAMEVERD